MIKLKRVYDHPQPSDEYRILVDRLWPRGLSKEDAKIDLWLKEIAPSSELRKWFSHDTEKWSGFQSKYKNELEDKDDLIHKLKGLEQDKDTITLLFSAKDQEHNNALVLKNYLDNLK